jgi:PAS domain-containing protein
VPSSTAISIIYALDAAVALAAAVVIWRRREAPGAMALSGMLLAAFWWAACDAIELHVPTVGLKQLVSQFQYLGVVAAAPAYFEAAIALAAGHRRLTARQRVAVWLVPVLSLGCAWTNDQHHWLWTRITPPHGDSPFATYHYGWWFWILTIQTYVLMAGASAALIRGRRHVSNGFRSAMIIVVIATLLPWIGNAAYNLKLGPWPGLNWLTLSLGVSGWLLAWVVTHGGLLDLLPQARGALLETMPDGVLVLDRAGRITFINEAARQTLRIDGAVILGLLGTSSLATLPVEWSGQRETPLPEGRRWLDVRVGPVFDRWQAMAGRIVVVRDVTAQKNLEQERERLIAELREALERVTQLEGLLPICSGCRSVHDDAGTWVPMETYLAAHAPVEFTHEICPACVARLYPELADASTSTSTPHNEAWPHR